MCLSNTAHSKNSIRAQARPGLRLHIGWHYDRQIRLDFVYPFRTPPMTCQQFIHKKKTEGVVFITCLFAHVWPIDCYMLVQHSTFQETNSQQVIPQTGLALMGFSRYCPSSLDLTNFVVRSCRGTAAEGAPAISGPGLAQARFLEIWKSGNLKIHKF